METDTPVLLSPCRARPSCYSEEEPRDRVQVSPSVNPAMSKGTLSAPWEFNKGQSPALLLQIFLSMLTLTFYVTPGRHF